MTFRSDDDAREERLRTLEKQLEDARRELSTRYLNCDQQGTRCKDDKGQHRRHETFDDVLHDRHFQGPRPLPLEKPIEPSQNPN